MNDEIRFALVGNQNCGKTTLYNQLTGANQHVGNFPGVTVGKKFGYIREHEDCIVTDLPGIYSLRPYSEDEIIARDFIVNEKPDGIINIVDATNIERNLYLTLQLMELDRPMVLALNMMDEVLKNGGEINTQRLSKLLGIPVIPISAARNEGIDALIKEAIRTVKSVKSDFFPKPHASHFKNNAAKDEAELAAMRYNFIESVCAKAVHMPQENSNSKKSKIIDNILLNRFFAIPLFLCIMLLIFWLTFDVVGDALCKWLSLGIDAVASFLDRLLTSYGVHPILHSLVIDGMFSGIGSVLSFLPIIIVLFFFLSMLEDTGYMARIAFILDKPLRKLGLSGKSAVAMLIGFGCSVPAIMATRTLRSEHDRRLTILLIPYMSCSAKIPIYTLFIAAFFPKYRALVMLGLYGFAVLVGVIFARLFGKHLVLGNSTPFVLELPNYRMPSLKTTLLLMWDKAGDFIKRTFTIILLSSMIVWFLQKFDLQFHEAADSAESILGFIGKILSSIFKPLGFSDWRASTAIITGIMAKETVVSTLGQLVGTEMLNSLFTPASALSFLVFTLLYTPCIAAIATINREIKSSCATLGIVIMQCQIAWLCAAIVYAVCGIFI